MEQVALHDIETFEGSRVGEARRHAHNALHWMTRLASSYCDFDGPVTLDWDETRDVIRTPQFGDGLSIECRLGALELQFCEHGEPVPHTLSFEERTPAHVEAWFLVELLHRGVERAQFSKELPYPGIDVMMGDSEEHEVEAFATELGALQAWFKNAAPICTAVGHGLKKDMPESAAPSAPVVWPETFQLGIDMPLPPGFGAPSLRVALSAGDRLRPEPFFFVATAEQSRSADFDAASVLGVNRIASERMTADDVIAFLTEGARAQRKRLAG